MPRRARVIIPHIPHHITQRGNNRQDVFVEEEDFSHYTYWINKYAESYRVGILAYCLMNNHVHFIVVPEDATGIARLFNTVHMRYAQYINYKRKTSGHLWQGRFFSCVMDDEHLFRAIRYVEQNPLRAKIVSHPWAYQWSSARWHVGMPARRYIKIKRFESINRSGWKEYLMNCDAELDERVRKATCKGKAVAGEKFTTFWENKLKCVLTDLKPGPRPKQKR